MKVLKIIIIALGVVATSSVYMACDKAGIELISTTNEDFSNKAMVQVYNGTLGSTRNYVYVDAAPVTGATFAYGATFPSTPSNFSVVAGFRAFLIRDTLPTTTQPLLSFAESFQANSRYSIFTYDTVNAIKQKTVKNEIVIPSDTTSRLRFANFVHSSLPVPAFDIFSARMNANIFSNVSLTEVTPFIPYVSRFPDTLYVRIAGSGTNLMNRTVSGGNTTFSPVRLILTPIRLRSYTVVFRGGYRTDLTSAGTVRTLSVFSNN